MANNDTADTEKETSEAHREQGRGVKRVRQACSNCRRKKVRCSGERPSCSFCVKLRQDCRYLRETIWDDRDSSQRGRTSPTDTDETLLARVSSLEAKLTQLDQLNEFLPALVNALDAPNSLARPTLGGLVETWSNKSHSPLSVESSSPTSLENTKFNELPPAPVLQSACNTFFQYCHNQPYTFFHEEGFRQRLQQGTWPEYLLFAVLSLAVRYSTDPWFNGKQVMAQEEYASNSWKLIVTSGCAVEEGADTAVVQAISLLAVVDSAAGRRRAAWVKIGLSVRLSQDLHLMMEPDASLPVIEQEERRRLFWSIYLLDHFVSCSKQRPPAILDSDCQVQLPCDEMDFRHGIPSKTDTLMNLGTGAGNGHSVYRPGQFALLVLMACVLGRCARYMLDNRHSAEERAPFHPQSEYVTISSILLYYESFIDSGSGVDEVVRFGMLKDDSLVDQQMAGHMILARALFHLNHCLLNHPFLLRQRVYATQTKTPTTWLARSMETGVKHAGLLTKVFRDAKNTGCNLTSSFYGYCLLIAGTIHSLYTYSQSAEVQQEAMEYLVAEIGYVDDIARFWKNSNLIASGLRTFWARSAKFSELLNPQPLQNPYSAADLNILWTSVDYGIMSDPEKSLSQSAGAEASSPLAWGFSPWKDESGNALGDALLATDSDFFLHHLNTGGSTTNEPFQQASDHQISNSDALFLQMHSTVFAPSQSNVDFVNPIQHSPNSNDNTTRPNGLEQSPF